SVCPQVRTESRSPFCHRGEPPLGKPDDGYRISRNLLFSWLGCTAVGCHQGTHLMGGSNPPVNVCGLAQEYHNYYFYCSDCTLVLKLPFRFLVCKSTPGMARTAFEGGWMVMSVPRPNKQYVLVEDCEDEDAPPLIDASDSDSDEDESDLEFEDDANENEEIVGASPGGDGNGSLSEDPNTGSGSNSGTAGASPEASPELARATRVNRGIPRERLNLAVVARQPEVPRTYDEAMASSTSQMWKQAMEEEIASLRANQVSTLEKLPKGVRALPVKWVFTIKRDANGEIVRYKARLVAKGFAQVEGRDFDEVFAPVSTPLCVY
ncbi:hypothetical protein VaNZ11_000379, partial [Volvox africanus]